MCLIRVRAKLQESRLRGPDLRSPVEESVLIHIQVASYKHVNGLKVKCEILAPLAQDSIQ